MKHCGHIFIFLKSILSTHPKPLVRDLKWTRADIQAWFKEADVKKCSKKRPLPPSTSYIHDPFEVLRFIMNDVFCEAPQATIHSATRATLAAAHLTEVMGEEAGWRVWDEAPYGTWQKTILPPKGGVFRTDCQPSYHPHGPLWGIEFLLAHAPKPSERVPKCARMTVIDSWLQAAGPRKDHDHADAKK